MLSENLDCVRYDPECADRKRFEEFLFSVLEGKDIITARMMQACGVQVIIMYNTCNRDTQLNSNDIVIYFDCKGSVTISIKKCLYEKKYVK